MKKSHKIILVLSLVLVAGYNWSLDMPLALEVPLRQEPYNFSNFDFNFLYFATYVAICFSDMPVGMLLDKFPIKKTILCIAAISLLSQAGILLMFYFQFPGYTVFIYIFRGIFGMSGQALYTTQALLISLYGGKYYDMLMGVGISVPMMLNSINNMVTPKIFDSTHSMELVWGIGVTMCGVGLVAGIIISIFISKQEKQQKEKDIQSERQQQEEGQLSFRGLKQMPRQFWVIVGAVFFTQFVIASYVDNLNDSIVKRFQISYVTAGYLMIIPFGAAGLLAFFLGLILQRKPKLRRNLLFSSTLFYSLGLLAVYFLPNIQKDQSPTSLHYIVIAIQFLSVSYQLAILYGVLSSAIVYVVDRKNLGIGWGLIGSTIGFSEAVGPLIIAAILQSEQTLANGYQKLALFIFFGSLFALAFSLWILFGEFSRIDVNSCQNIPEVDIKESLLEIENEIQTQNKIINQ